jgi:hypothetical protein
LLSGGAGSPTWGAASTVVTASNGLTASVATPTNIVLGGTLSQTTTITQGANNMIYNLNGTGDFQIQKSATDIMHVYSANSNVGLATGTAANPSYTFTSNTDLGIYRNAANDMRFVSNGVDRMRISKASASTTSEVWVNLVSPYVGDVFSATSNVDGDYGVNGYNTAAVTSAGGSAGGVYGEARSLNAPGVWGFSNIAGSTAAGGTGVLGSTNALVSNVLVAGSGGAFTGNTTGIYALANAAGFVSTQAIYTNNFGNIVRVGYYNGGGTFYKINGAGSVATVVKDVNNNNVNLHAPETPEYYFEDYGEGKLLNGRVHITLDPTLIKNVTINEKHPLRVFIQLEGDCNGVYITNKTSSGFDVVELKGGTSATSFQWNIVCNVADQEMANGRISKFADLRFEPTGAPLPTREIKKPSRKIDKEPLHNQIINK